MLTLLEGELLPLHWYHLIPSSFLQKKLLKNSKEKMAMEWLGNMNREIVRIFGHNKRSIVPRMRVEILYYTLYLS